MADLLRRVDYSLYFAWALILGALGFVIFLWLAEQCGLLMAIAGSLVFLLHPASIFFATYLDTTLLSAFLILWAYYLLWRIKNGRQVSIWLLVADHARPVLYQIDFPAPHLHPAGRMSLPGWGAAAGAGDASSW